MIGKKAINRFTISCFSLTALLGILTLIGWVEGEVILSGLLVEWMPMAPSTAFLFTFFGGMMLLVTIWPDNRRLRLIAWATLAGLTLISVILLILSVNGESLQLEHLGFSITGNIGRSPVGYMSPVSSICFALSGFAALLYLYPKQLPETTSQFTVGLSLATSLISTIFIIPYLMGKPFLYDVTTIPPALSTLVAFILLNVGIAVQVVFSQFTILGIDQGKIKRIILPLFAALIVFSGMLFLIGYYYFSGYEQQYKEGSNNQLKAVARIKAAQVSDFINEYRLDAQFLHTNPLLARHVKEMQKNGDKTGARRELEGWIDSYRRTEQYDRILVFDSAANLLFAFPSTGDRLNHIRSTIRNLQQRDTIYFQDFSLDQETGQVELSILIPLRDPLNQSIVLGYTVLQVYPENSIYPILVWWPIDSTTAETVMVRKDSIGIFVLNPLYSDTSKAFYLPTPVRDPDCNCIEAAEGKEGAVSGNNCQGIPVLAYATAIPGTSWSLITRMDLREVYQPIRERFWNMIIVITLLIVLTELLVVLWIHNQRIDFFRKKLKAEALLLESETRFRLIFENSMDAILLTVPDGRILSANPAACQIFGYTEEEILRMGRNGLVDPSDTRLVKAFEARETSGGFLGTITLLRRNREPFEAEISSSEFETKEGEKRTSMIIRDITEQKNSERTLKESEEKFQKAFMAAPYALILTLPADGAILQVNKGFVQITGFEAEEVLGKSTLALNLWVDPADRVGVVRELGEKSMVARQVFRFRRKSGEILYGFFSAELLKIRNQTVILSAIDDITELKLTEDKLRKEMVRLEVMNELMVDRELKMIEMKKEIEKLKKGPTQE